MRDKKTLFALHFLLMLYSLTGLFSKMASSASFLSLQFCLSYGAVIVLLGIYAIGWQQIIKRLPLSTAFANKAVTVLWGLIWGILFAEETVTWGKLLGVSLVIVGVMVYSSADQEE